MFHSPPYQWRIRDFSDGEDPKRERINIILAIFPNKNCMKLKKKNGLGTLLQLPSLDLPNTSIQLQTQLTFVVIYLTFISKWPPSSRRLLWL